MPLMKCFVPLLLLFFAVTVAAEIEQSDRLAGFSLLDLSAPATATESTTIEVDSFAQSWRLVLKDHQRPFSKLSHEKKLAMSANGARFMAGHIEGNPASWVRLNWIDGKWSGGFFDGNELYLIGGIANLKLPEGHRLSADQTALYRFSDLEMQNAIDHTLNAYNFSEVPTGMAYADFIDHLSQHSRGSDAMILLPVTIVSDTDFSALHQENVAAIVAGRINFADGIFSEQLGVGILLWHHEILNDNGPLISGDPFVLLQEQFRPFMEEGAGQTIPSAGVAHLFVDRFLQGFNGVAYTPGICTAFGYGLTRQRGIVQPDEVLTSLTFAHELGHNFGAPHDGEGACTNEPFRGLMAPAASRSELSNCSIQQMSMRVSGIGRLCLIENPELAALFEDGFENG